MSKHQRAAAVASGFLLLVSAGAAAAQAGRVSPAARPSAASEALVRRYLAAVHYQDTVLTMVKAQSPDLIQGMGAGFPAATRAEARRVDEMVNAFVRDQMLPALAAKMVPVYASLFSESELRALAEFYESPAGQALVEKMPIAGKSATDAMRDLMPGLERDLRTSICAKIDCKARPEPPGPES